MINDHEDGFKIEQSLDGRTFTQIATVGINVRSYSRPGLNSGTKYYFRVRAFHGGGDSAYSNVAVGTPFTGNGRRGKQK